VDALRKKMGLNRFTSFHVKKMICNISFKNNPHFHVVKLLIERGDSHPARWDDLIRAVVVSQIPFFVDYIAREEHLRKIAASLYKKHPQKEKILAVFEKSLTTPLFQSNYRKVLSQLRDSPHSFSQNESNLRFVLDVFNQAEYSEVYHE
jgi:hypothetical protein